jgi:hypothetical protein
MNIYFNSKRVIFACIKSDIFMTKQPFSLKLPPEIMEKVRAQALKEHRPVNNLIEVALLEYLERVKEKPQSK